MKEEQRNFSKEEYHKVYQKIDLMIAIAVFLILLGVTGLVVGAEFLKEGQMFFGILWLIILIWIAAVFILMAGFQNRNYRKSFKRIPDCYQEEEKKKVKKKLNRAFLSGGILLGMGVVLAVISYGIELVEKLSLLPVAFIFWLLSCILPQIAYWKLEQEKMDIAKYNEQDEKEDKKKASVCGIGILITCGFTILGAFLFKDWDISFLIFSLGSIISIIIGSKCGEKKHKGENCYGKDTECDSNQRRKDTNPNS